MELHQSQEEGEITEGFVQYFLWKIELLATPLFKSFGPKSKPTCIYEEDLEPLKRKLARIRATLNDSENLEIRDESQKLWLRELREVECSAEDILEELEYEVVRTSKLADFRCKLRRNRISSKRKHEEVEVGLLLSSPPVKSLRRKIAKIWESYREIASDRNALRSREGDGERRLPYCSPRVLTSSLTGGYFHGRNDEVKEVIRLLISDEGHGCDISVIPVDGMGGVGKTALAQHVYNDKAVCSHFNLRIWICTSQGLDVLKVTKAIREALRLETCCPSELDLLQQDVMNQLRGKRFLLVLDDVWSDEHWEIHWERIQDPLKVGAKGSKIIMTTRNSRVAKIMGAVPSRHLSCLSDDDCWTICEQHAFGRQDFSAHINLIPIGKEINQKCRGLPLAAKVVGCLLRTALNEEHWRRVLEDLWSRQECENEILRLLRLSYDHLPMRLKRCFLYCSLFPKGYIFKKDQLVRLWIAQGFLEPDGSSKIKERASKCFDELVERSFFQHSPSFDYRGQRYVMHDLFHELAQSIASLDCKRMEDCMLCEVHKKTQHSSLILCESSIEKSVQFDLIDGQDLRSLLLIRRCEHIETPFHVEVPDFLLLQCLRALDLSNTNIEKLPVSIGNLIHLRYLGLRNTKIKGLPESICGLFKLQTLDLKQCRHLQELPRGIKLLSDLQHLGLPSHYPDIFMPFVIEDLTDLQKQAVVIEGDEPGCNVIGCLRTFKMRYVADGPNAEGEILTEELEIPSEVNTTMVQLQQQQQVL